MSVRTSHKSGNLCQHIWAHHPTSEHFLVLLFPWILQFVLIFNDCYCHCQAAPCKALAVCLKCETCRKKSHTKRRTKKVALRTPGKYMQIRCQKGPGFFVGVTFDNKQKLEQRCGQLPRQTVETGVLNIKPLQKINFPPPGFFNGTKQQNKKPGICQWYLKTLGTYCDLYLIIL